MAIEGISAPDANPDKIPIKPNILSLSGWYLYNENHDTLLKSPTDSGLIGVSVLPFFNDSIGIIV